MMKALPASAQQNVSMRAIKNLYQVAVLSDTRPAQA